MVEEFAPDVARILFRLGEDWTGDPAIFFRAIFTDESVRTKRYLDVARAMREKINDEFSYREKGRIPYLSVTSESDHAKMKDSAWD